jgi:hypothetical protein
LFRYDGDLNVAGLNVEDRIGRVALSEDGLAALVFHRRSPRHDWYDALGIDALNFLSCLWAVSP